MEIINKDMVLTDTETGLTIPIKKGSKIETPEDKEKKKQRMEDNWWLKQYTSDKKGAFFWTMYYPEEDYYPDVPDAMLARVMYLLTYMKYDSNILVMRDDSYSPYRPMTKDDVKDIMGVYQNSFNSFWDELMALNIITEDSKGNLVVSGKFKRGRLGKRDKQDMCAMKIFSHCVRYLYENTKTRSHKCLGYLYRLIPYINLRYNVFCLNPLETRKDKIKWLTAKDMCAILGVDEHNEKRLVDMLFKIMFVDKNGDTRSVIKMLQDVKNGETRRFITINPQFYSGYTVKRNEIDEIDVLMKEFLIDTEEEYVDAAQTS